MSLRLIHSAAAEQVSWQEPAEWHVDAADPGNGDLIIVDDDPTVRYALAMMFAQAGFQVTTFTDGSSFLAHTRTDDATCILLDVYMPGISGLEVLKKLAARDCSAPIFILSGRGDIPTAIQAIRMGAFDFIEKRWPAEAIVARVSETLKTFARFRQNPDTIDAPPLQFGDRYLLTAREHEVLRQIMAAASTKEAARALGISPRTVEVHRSHIMHKLGAKNVADLARIVMRAKCRM
jgi:two-component system, LuxR family, response regulator FixJ